MYTPLDFIETLPETSTRKTYLTALTRYLEILKDKKIPKCKLNQTWAAYMARHLNPDEDLMQFAHLAETSFHLAPKTIRLYEQIAVLYMREAGVAISEKTIRIFRTKTAKNKPITRDAELDRVLLQQIIRDAELRLRTEILLAVSSGMRIGEILSIREKDVNLAASPAVIYLRPEYTKNRTARVVFISKEAAVCLNEWLAFLNAHKLAGKIRKNDTRIFPYSLSNEIASLRRHLRVCGFLEEDERTGRATIHFHLFRKYFLTEFKLAASAEVAEELAGHNGYLSDSYRRLSLGKMRDEYKKAEENLTVYKSDDDKQTQLSDMISMMQKQINELSEEINRLNKYMITESAIE